MAVQYPRDSRVCQFLLRRRWVSVDQLTAAAEEQRGERDQGFPPRTLEEILAERGALTPDRLQAVSDYASATPTPPPTAATLSTQMLEKALAATGDRIGDADTGRLSIGSLTEDETNDGGFGGNGPTLSTGTRVGDFLIVGRIGRGGGGTVYLAKAENGVADRVVGSHGGRLDLGREPLVALKVFGDRNSHRGSRERFLREARVACLLRHHGVVAGLDAGEFEGGFYYAMEYVEGQSLRDAIDRSPTGRLDELRVLDVAIRMTLALDFVHGLGFVHRDVKPDNILLGYDGSVRMCDLGLARPIVMQAGLTTTGVALGTPRYIAPEQARANGDVDARCDIYSLGITLFHALVGEPPFLGDSGIVIMSRHLYEDVPAVRERNPDISPEMNEVVLRMTRRERGARYTDARELLDALLEVAASYPELEDDDAALAVESSCAAEDEAA